MITEPHVIGGITEMNCIRASPAQLQPSQSETHAPITAGEQVEARDKKSGSTAINHGTCPCDTLAPSGRMNCRAQSVIKRDAKARPCLPVII